MPDPQCILIASTQNSVSVTPSAKKQVRNKVMDVVFFLKVKFY